MQSAKLNHSKDDLKLRSYKFSLRIFKFVDILPRQYSARVVANQLVRSATSIGANVVEAQASTSKLEFKKFFEIALKSANETGYWLCLIRDAKWISGGEVELLLQESTELARMLGKSVITLKSNLKK